SDAARAGATTIIALTIKLDPSVGADHLRARVTVSTGCPSAKYFLDATVQNADLGVTQTLEDPLEPFSLLLKR
ncbi:hypothetical protein, partial [Chelativorans composti]